MTRLRITIAALAGFLVLASLAGTGKAQNGYPVAAPAFSGAPINVTTVNHSAAIATGNTFQTVLTAVPSNGWRRSLTVNNNNATDSCWVFFGSGTASKATSILLLSGQTLHRYWPFVPGDAVQVTCATTADTIYVDTQ